MDLSALMSLKEIPVLYALAIGILTAIGPCPMSANVTAIAYVSARLANPRATMIAGAMYTAGRALTYVILGLAIFAFGSAMMDNAPQLQDYEKIILAPVLILTGVIMLGLWKPAFSLGDKLKERYSLPLAQSGILGAFGLGAVFALAFCPYTAVMFFGLLIPFALQYEAMGVSYIGLFGIGTGLPVLLFAILLGTSTSIARSYIARLTRFEPYVRKILGVGFILYGLYLGISYFIA